MCVSCTVGEFEIFDSPDVGLSDYYTNVATRGIMFRVGDIALCLLVHA